MTKRINREKVTEWLLGNNFCAMPYIHMAVGNAGSIRACCVSGSVKDANQSPINVDDMSLHDAFNHPARELMLEQFNRGNQYAECSRCWQNNDRFSPRVKFSTNLKTIEFTQQVMAGVTPTAKLEYLEIKAGTRCNLKCRICSYQDSSQWVVESNNYTNATHNINTQIKDSEYYKYTKKTEWIDNVEFWKNTDALQDLKYLHILGGEPMLVPEHFAMLEKLVADGISTNIVVIYNTNGTVFPTDEQIEILRKFKTVQINISIDDTGKRFEYQRKNASWENVVDIIDMYVELSHKYTNILLTLDSTVSIFNILYLEDMIVFAQLKNIKLSNLHFVGGVNLYNIRTLSAEIKKEITKVYANSIHIDHHYLKDALTYMQVDLWSDRKDRDRQYKTQFLDNSRKEKFSNIFPEMAQLLNYE